MSPIPVLLTRGSVGSLLVGLSTLCLAQNPAATAPDTRFPGGRFLDYDAAMDCRVSVAYPLNQQTGRVVMHGSAQRASADIFNAQGQKLVTVELLPPTYTSSWSTALDSVRVVFSSARPEPPTDGKWVFPKKLADLNPTTPAQRDFSILVYGCFQPFTIADSPPQPYVIQGDYGKTNWRMRRLFQGVVAQDSAQVNVSVRRADAPIGSREHRKIGIPQNAGSFRGLLLAPPRLVIGTGDQVYMDAGYETDEQEKDKPGANVMIGWRDTDSIPRLHPTQFAAHVQRMYQHFGAFSTLDAVFRRLPSINVWDDHEIWDGWGSHYDDYSGGKLSASRKPFYQLARQGYVAHQWQLGPRAGLDLAAVTSNSHQSLHQEFTVGGVRGFAFDLRSNRDISREQVLGPEQWQAFEQWVEQCQPNEEVILVSPAPLFFGFNHPVKKVTLKLRPDATDDLADGWDAPSSRAEYNRLIRLLIRLREQKLARPIILSGDVHVGVITEIWYSPSASPDNGSSSKRVLAYELVASGLSHETLNPLKMSLLKRAKDRSQSERVGQDDLSIEGYDVDPQVKTSQALLNFGSVEFRQNRTWLHLFVSDQDSITEAEGPTWQYSGMTDWDKTWATETSRQYRVGKQRFLRQYYSPALLDQFRDIRIDQTPWLQTPASPENTVPTR